MRLAELYKRFNELHSEAIECVDREIHNVLLDQMESIVEAAKKLTEVKKNGN